MLIEYITQMSLLENNQLGLQASLEDDARWLVHIPLAVILKPLGLGIHKNRHSESVRK